MTVNTHPKAHIGSNLKDVIASWNYHRYGKRGQNPNVVSSLGRYYTKKILTANNLIKRNWPNDPICKLCGIEPETPNHLCLHCPFAKQVWTDLTRWLNLSMLHSVLMTGTIYSFWRKCRNKVDKRLRRKFDGIIIYFWWNLWKERNRRTFQHRSVQAHQVAMLCKDDITQFQWATQEPTSEE